MLLREVRAKRRKAEAITLEGNGKYKLASSIYSMAKYLWSNIKGSEAERKFCDNKIEYCNYMATANDCDDDDEFI